MSVKIMIDSASDINKREAEELGVNICLLTSNQIHSILVAQSELTSDQALLESPSSQNKERL